MEIIGDRYRIEYLAGSGGFGSLYKGYDTRMDRHVAIKRENRIEDREAHIMKILDHRGLPRLYDICKDGGYTYVVMEWIPGINLEDYMAKNGAITETQAIGIGRELLEILNYLHGFKNPIIYQDLKPSNIMLMPNGHIKLVDFGTAFSLKYNDDKIISAGTVGYSSPEQRGIHGPLFADERSDLYSWGACMYSFVSGRSLSKPPYTMQGPRKVCPGLSHGLEKIIIKATNRDPDKRYKNAEMVMAALDKTVYVDAIYRLGWAIAIIIAVVPFMLSWFGAYKADAFGYIERALEHTWKLTVYTGNRPLLSFFFWKKMFSKELWITYAGNIVLMALGRLLLATSWMVLGFKLLSMGRIVRVRRSVYLTEKRFPGLGVWTLIIGMTFGYMISSITGAYEVNAAEGDEKLPVSMVDENGMKTIVRYDAVYSPQGNLRLEIPAEVLGGGEEKNLTVSLRNNEGKVASRSFVLK